MSTANCTLNATNNTSSVDDSGEYIFTSIVILMAPVLACVAGFYIVLALCKWSSYLKKVEMDGDILHRSIMNGNISKKTGLIEILKRASFMMCLTFLLLRVCSVCTQSLSI